jgi:hypothetical protein
MVVSSEHELPMEVDADEPHCKVTSSGVSTEHERDRSCDRRQRAGAGAHQGTK